MQPYPKAFGSFNLELFGSFSVFAPEFNRVTLIKNNYICLPAHILSKAWISQLIFQKYIT